jgi:hypothetical protein
MKRLDGEIRRELDRVGSERQDPTAAGSLNAIVAAWPAAVGAENARRAWPARIGRDGVLVVHASDAVWAFQLGMLASSILERLAATLGAATPRKLRFVPGPIPGREPAPSHENAPEPPPVAPGDAAKGAVVAAPIEDDELRESVARAVAASLARSRSDRAF